MNARDKITVIAAKLEAAQERRHRMIDDDIRALRCFNKAFRNGNGRSACERFTESLEELRESMSD